MTTIGSRTPRTSGGLIGVISADDVRTQHLVPIGIGVGVCGEVDDGISADEGALESREIGDVGLLPREPAKREAVRETVAQDARDASLAAGYRDAHRLLHAPSGSGLNVAIHPEEASGVVFGLDRLE